MIAEDIRQLLQTRFPNAVINVKGEDANFSVEVISPVFENINKLNRQKRVLSCVSQQITEGEIHSFSVQAYTLEEWNKNANSLNVL